MKKKCKAKDCRKAFYPTTSWQEYCSRQCRQRIWKRGKVKVGKK